MKRALALMMTAALAGCGGGSSGSQPLTIAAYGDSTTWGSTGSGIANPTLPQMLASDLHTEVKNDGVPGATTTSWLAGTCPQAAQTVNACPQGAWAQDMASETASVVTIDLGINDAWQLGMPVGQFIANLREMVQIAQADGKTVILITSNATTGSYEPLLASYIPAEKQLAQQFGVPLVDEFSYVQSVPAWQSMLGDGVTHPSQQLYDLMAAYEAQQISPIVGN